MLCIRVLIVERKMTEGFLKGKSQKKTCQKFLVWEGIIDKFLIALLSFIFFSLTSSFFPLIFPLLLSAAKPSDLGVTGGLRPGGLRPGGLRPGGLRPWGIEPT